jgi:hypothetical protein
VAHAWATFVPQSVEILEAGVAARERRKRIAELARRHHDGRVFGVGAGTGKAIAASPRTHQHNRIRPSSAAGKARKGQARHGAGAHSRVSFVPTVIMERGLGA